MLDESERRRLIEGMVVLSSMKGADTQLTARLSTRTLAWWSEIKSEMFSSYSPELKESLYRTMGVRGAREESCILNHADVEDFTKHLEDLYVREMTQQDVGILRGEEVGDIVAHLRELHEDDVAERLVSETVAYLEGREDPVDRVFSRLASPDKGWERLLEFSHEQVVYLSARVLSIVRSLRTDDDHGGVEGALVAARECLEGVPRVIGALQLISDDRADTMLPEVVESRSASWTEHPACDDTLEVAVTFPRGIRHYSRYLLVDHQGA